MSDETQNRLLRIESFGVKIEIETGTDELCRFVASRLDDILPGCWQASATQSFNHRFYLTEGRDGYQVFKNGLDIGLAESLERGFGMLESSLRLTVAEFTEQVVFLHAGVVGWKNRALIIPGKSFSGKTTLVAEFVKRGCPYLSDEYAILDRRGLVHPFLKKLSVRGIVDDFTQTDFEVEQLGGKKCPSPLPAGFLLVTEYRRDTVVRQLSEASIGAGVLACLANSISIRQHPQIVLETIGSALAGCRIFKNERGDAADLVNLFAAATEKGARAGSWRVQRRI